MIIEFSKLGSYEVIIIIILRQYSLKWSSWSQKINSFLNCIWQKCREVIKFGREFDVAKDKWVKSERWDDCKVINGVFSFICRIEIQGFYLKQWRSAGDG